MKYRIRIWIATIDDQYYYNNIDFHFSCEPPAGKYSHSDAIFIMSEKMREFVEKKKLNRSSVIDIYDYETDEIYAKNYIYYYKEPKKWTLNYWNVDTWTSTSFPYNEI